MPLTDLKSFKDAYSISSDIKDQRLEFFIGAASRRLRGWVGTEAYTDAGSANPTNVERAEDLKAAEFNLAFHYALLGLNAPVKAEGIVASAEKTNGVTVTYRSPKEVREYMAIALENAQMIAQPYMAEASTVEIMNPTE